MTDNIKINEDLMKVKAPDYYDKYEDNADNDSGDEGDLTGLNDKDSEQHSQDILDTLGNKHIYDYVKKNTDKVEDKDFLKLLKRNYLGLHYPNLNKEDIDALHAKKHIDNEERDLLHESVNDKFNNDVKEEDVQQMLHDRLKNDEELNDLKNDLIKQHKYNKEELESPDDSKKVDEIKPHVKKYWSELDNETKNAIKNSAKEHGKHWNITNKLTNYDWHHHPDIVAGAIKDAMNKDGKTFDEHFDKHFDKEVNKSSSKHLKDYKQYLADKDLHSKRVKSFNEKTDPKNHINDDSFKNDSFEKMKQYFADNNISEPTEEHVKEYMSNATDPNLSLDKDFISSANKLGTFHGGKPENIEHNIANAYDHNKKKIAQDLATNLKHKKENEPDSEARLWYYLTQLAHDPISQSSEESGEESKGSISRTNQDIGLSDKKDDDSKVDSERNKALEYLNIHKNELMDHFNKEYLPKTGYKSIHDIPKEKYIPQEILEREKQDNMEQSNHLTRMIGDIINTKTFQNNPNYKNKKLEEQQAIAKHMLGDRLLTRRNDDHDAELDTEHDKAIDNIIDKHSVNSNSPTSSIDDYFSHKNESDFNNKEGTLHPTDTKNIALNYHHFNKPTEMHPDILPLINSNKGLIRRVLNQLSVKYGKAPSEMFQQPNQSSPYGTNTSTKTDELIHGPELTGHILGALGDLKNNDNESFASNFATNLTNRIQNNIKDVSFSPMASFLNNQVADYNNKNKKIEQGKRLLKEARSKIQEQSKIQKPKSNEIAEKLPSEHPVAERLKNVKSIK